MAELTAYAQSGEPLHLKELGRSGAEGVIYKIDGEQGLCAKIFREEKRTDERLHKIMAMVRSPPIDPMWLTEGHHSIAWPSCVLYSDALRRHFCGFAMPWIDTSVFRESHQYYDTDDRVNRIEETITWANLFYTAYNLTSAIGAIHAKGHRVGDLRETNVLVAPTALVTLVDCDSFQVLDAESGTPHYARVCTPEYLPPETQGVDFSRENYDRLYSDRFALAVLLFKFLMLGCHPYQARGRQVEDAGSIEAKIGKGFFAYSGRCAGLQPPKFAPPYEIVPPPLRTLFDRCFEAGHSVPHIRPSAEQWYQAFRQLHSRFKQCPLNGSHLFGDHLAECPWCCQMRATGVDPFPAKDQLGRQVTLSPAKIVCAQRPPSNQPLSPTRPPTTALTHPTAVNASGGSSHPAKTVATHSAAHVPGAHLKAAIISLLITVLLPWLLAFAAAYKLAMYGAHEPVYRQASVINLLVIVPFFVLLPVGPVVAWLYAFRRFGGHLDITKEFIKGILVLPIQAIGWGIAALLLVGCPSSVVLGWFMTSYGASQTTNAIFGIALVLIALWATVKVARLWIDYLWDHCSFLLPSRTAFTGAATLVAVCLLIPTGVLLYRNGPSILATIGDTIDSRSGLADARRKQNATRSVSASDGVGRFCISAWPGFWSEPIELGEGWSVWRAQADGDSVRWRAMGSGSTESGQHGLEFRSGDAFSVMSTDSMPHAVVVETYAAPTPSWRKARPLLGPSGPSSVAGPVVQRLVSKGEGVAIEMDGSPESRGLLILRAYDAATGRLSGDYRLTAPRPPRTVGQAILPLLDNYDPGPFRCEGELTGSQLNVTLLFRTDRSRSSPLRSSLFDDRLLSFEIGLIPAVPGTWRDGQTQGSLSARIGVAAVPAETVDEPRASNPSANTTQVQSKGSEPNSSYDQRTAFTPAAPTRGAEPDRVRSVVATPSPANDLSDTNVKYDRRIELARQAAALNRWDDAREMAQYAMELDKSRPEAAALLRDIENRPRASADGPRATPRVQTDHAVTAPQDPRIVDLVVQHAAGQEELMVRQHQQTEALKQGHEEAKLAEQERVERENRQIRSENSIIDTLTREMTLKTVNGEPVSLSQAGSAAERHTRKHSREYVKTEIIQRKEGEELGWRHVREFEQLLERQESEYGQLVKELGISVAAATPESQCDVGEAHLRESNPGVADLARALRAFKHGASMGHPRSQFCLGTMYFNGIGVDQDHTAARSWFEKAATLGDAKAKAHLGWCYMYGLGGKRDKQRAIALYREAAQAACCAAQRNLADLYATGTVVRKDVTEAAKLYSAAAPQYLHDAMQGDGHAQYVVGMMYENGQGVAQDDAQAIKWFEKAAAWGIAPAERNYGYMLYRGKGTRADRQRGLEWIRLAAVHGDTQAKELFDDLD